MPTGVYTRPPRTPIDPLPRFWSKVQKTATCWLWQGGLDKDGYGRFWVDGSTQRAHAWIFARLVRPLLEGEQCCHTCDTPGCIRPDHLYGGTQAQNIQDAWRRHRAVLNARPQRGSRNGNSTLTEEQVREIRAKYRSSPAGHRSTTSFNALAREYGVSKFAIQYAVKHGWRHLSDSVTV